MGSVSAHQIFLLTSHTSGPYLKSEGSVHLFQMISVSAVIGLAGLRRASRIITLKYAFQKAVRDPNEDSQALEQANQRGCAVFIF